MFNIHFLYPYWLLLIPIWLLFLLLLFILQQRRKHQLAQHWDQFIDPQLQPYVLSNKENHSIAGRGRWLWSVAIGLAIVALAGPSLHKKQQPAYQLEQGLVIALDLSTSMLSEDNKPSRMQRAKFKLIDLVHQRKEGQTGLVVFAAEAFSVSPLTTEMTTLTAQVEHLTPAAMPAQGSRVDRAIEQSIQLLKQAGLRTGHILLLTDGAANQEKAEAAAKKAQAAYYTVSIIAFGTTQGSLIPLSDGGVVKNRQGGQVISRLDPLSLKKIAQAGGGLYSEARTDNKDLKRLMDYYKKNSLLAYDKNKTSKQRLYTSINDGIWLLLPLIPLFLLLFRQGYLLSLLLLVFIAQPQAVYAFEWGNLWLNNDQRAKRLFEQKDFAAAEKQFNNQHWQAVSAYQQDDYQRAQQLLKKADTAEDWYNKGTIFAKMGKLHEAVSALQLALKRQPSHEDARYNLKIIQDHLLTKRIALFDKENPQFAKKAAKNKEENKQQHTQEGQKKVTEQEKEKQQLSKQKSTDPTSQQEQERFKQQWLRSIPDDPSGLWRRKFKQQYQQRGANDEEEHW